MKKPAGCFFKAQLKTFIECGYIKKQQLLEVGSFQAIPTACKCDLRLKEPCATHPRKLQHDKDGVALTCFQTDDMDEISPLKKTFLPPGVHERQGN